MLGFVFQHWTGSDPKYRWNERQTRPYYFSLIHLPTVIAITHDLSLRGLKGTGRNPVAQLCRLTDFKKYIIKTQAHSRRTKGMTSHVVNPVLKAPPQISKCMAGSLWSGAMSLIDWIKRIKMVITFSDCSNPFLFSKFV